MLQINSSVIIKPFILIDRSSHMGKSKVQFTPNLIKFHVRVCMHIDAQTYTHSTHTIDRSTDLNIVRNDSSTVGFWIAFGPTKYTLWLLRRGKQRLRPKGLHTLSINWLYLSKHKRHFVAWVSFMMNNHRRSTSNTIKFVHTILMIRNWAVSRGQVIRAPYCGDVCGCM